MATATTNLALRKPDSTDLINVTTDLNQNFDKIDATYDAWVVYTPTWGSVGTAPVLGNGSVVGRYKKNGKLLQINILFTVGTTSTFGGAGMYFTLPTGLVTPASVGQFVPSFFWNGSYWAGFATIASSATALFPFVHAGAANGSLVYPTATIPGAMTNGCTISIQGSLEVA